MKKQYFIYLLAVIFSGIIISACKKDGAPEVVVKPNYSMTEEFDSVINLYKKGWTFTNFSVPQGTGTWKQGVYAPGKFGPDGFAAFSYSASGSEYVYADFNVGSGLSVCNTWIFTPALMMKNGDKFSFYTRSIGGTYPDRMQVRLNTDDNTDDVGTQNALSVGKFTKLFVDINSALQPSASGGYSTTWTKYEFTISGLPNIAVPLPRRIGFRYYVTDGGPSGANSNAIGIDLFKFESL